MLKILLFLSVSLFFSVQNIKSMENSLFLKLTKIICEKISTPFTISNDSLFTYNKPLEIIHTSPCEGTIEEQTNHGVLGLIKKLNNFGFSLQDIQQCTICVSHYNDGEKSLNILKKHCPSLREIKTIFQDMPDNCKIMFFIKAYKRNDKKKANL